MWKIVEGRRKWKIEKGNITYLASNMAPIVLTPQRLQILLKERTHLDNAISHALHFTKPLLVERRVVEDCRGNAGAVDGWAGVQGADEDLDLRINALLLLGRLADDGKCADSFTV